MGAVAAKNQRAFGSEPKLQAVSKFGTCFDASWKVAILSNGADVSAGGHMRVSPAWPREYLPGESCSQAAVLAQVLASRSGSRSNPSISLATSTAKVCLLSCLEVAT